MDLAILKKENAVIITIPIDVTVHLENLREQSKNNWCTGKLLFSTHEWPRDIHEFDYHQNLHLHLQPGEVKIIKL